jgi:hypothetical protein
MSAPSHIMFDLGFNDKCMEMYMESHWLTQCSACVQDASYKGPERMGSSLMGSPSKGCFFQSGIATEPLPTVKVEHMSVNEHIPMHLLKELVRFVRSTYVALKRPSSAEFPYGWNQMSRLENRGPFLERGK